MPSRRYDGGAGRCARAKWWPKERAEFSLHLLKSAGRNAEPEGLHVDSLATEHVQVNKAPRMWRRTSRAQPIHELSLPQGTSLTEKGWIAPKAEEAAAQEKKASQKKLK